MNYGFCFDSNNPFGFGLMLQTSRYPDKDKFNCIFPYIAIHCILLKTSPFHTICTLTAIQKVNLVY